MSLTNETIEHLVALCKQNNQKAQFEVYTRYNKAMYNVALRIVKDAHFAEDVMQEGFLKAFQKLDSFKNEVAFGAWLKRIIVNYSIDFYKKNKLLGYDDFESSLYKIESEPEYDETDYTQLKAQHVLNSIQNLKENYRIILTLVLIEGFDLEEVCQLLNLSYANCRTTLSRAKENLRKQLAEMQHQ